MDKLADILEKTWECEFEKSAEPIVDTDYFLKSALETFKRLQEQGHENY